MQLPQDDSSQVLAEMAAQGVDLNQHHNVDFFILFEKEPPAQSFIKALAESELQASATLETCKDTGVFEVKTTINMVPQLELINTTEAYLESLADKHEGYGDGWGILGDE